MKGLSTDNPKWMAFMSKPKEIQKEEFHRPIIDRADPNEATKQLYLSKSKSVVEEFNAQNVRKDQMKIVEEFHKATFRGESYNNPNFNNLHDYNKDKKEMNEECIL